MPNIKSAKKRVLVNAKKNAVNKDNKSEVKSAIKKLNAVIESGNYEEAMKLGKEALSLADTTNRLDMRLLYDMLKRAAIWLNKPEEALHYSQMQITMKEEDLNAEWADKISEIETKYETAKKELEILSLTTKTKTSRMMIISLIIIIVIGGIYYYIKNKRIIRKLRLK